MKENDKSQNAQPKEDYQSWDPLTQSKFIYEINRQTGTPISRDTSYTTATLAIEGEFNFKKQQNL